MKTSREKFTLPSGKEVQVRYLTFTETMAWSNGKVPEEEVGRQLLTLSLEGSGLDLDELELRDAIFLLPKLREINGLGGEVPPTGTTG